MSLDEMLAELPKLCNHGAKKNAKGFDDLARLQTAYRHGGLRSAAECHPHFGIYP